MLIVFNAAGEFVDSTGVGGALTAETAPSWWREYVGTIPDPVLRWVGDTSPEAAHVIRHGGRGVSLVEGAVILEEPTPDPEALAAAARAERTRLLAACDWTQLADAPLSTEQQEAWAAYRQALRDVPGQEGFPLSVEWPVPPA